MKSNDLRQGNYIQDYSGNLEKAEILYSVKGVQVNQEFSHDAYEPIQLNAEWLTKFGFQPTGTSWLLDTENFNDFDVQLIDEAYFLNSDGLPFSNGFRYVHQLQNLYFALTSEELTIK